jgi:hypothetical protein
MTVYAVPDDQTHMMYFVAVKPEGIPGVIDDVTLEVEKNINDWPPGTERTINLLCVSDSDDRHFKLFKSRKSAEREFDRFRPYELTA